MAASQGDIPASALAVGDAVLVGSERAADMGSFEGKGFVPKFSERYDCPHIPADAPLPVVASNSVSGAASPHVDRSAAQIENMEGAAFFDVCLRERIPFWELRAISNTVGEPFGQWNIPLATDALARAIGRLLQTAEIRTAPRGLPDEHISLRPDGFASGRAAKAAYCAAPSAYQAQTKRIETQ